MFAKTVSDNVNMSISVSLPETMHDWVREYAAECGVSMSQLVKALIVAHRADVTNEEEAGR